MKIFFTTIILFVFAHCSLGQKNVKGPIMLFDNYELIDTVTSKDINEDGSVKYPIYAIFRFTNIGTEPLIVNHWYIIRVTNTMWLTFLINL